MPSVVLNVINFSRAAIVVGIGAGFDSVLQYLPEPGPKVSNEPSSYLDQAQVVRPLAVLP